MEIKSKTYCSFTIRRAASMGALFGFIPRREEEDAEPESPDR